jgi:hypothetical protein
LIGSHVIDGVHNLVTSSSNVKLMGSLTSHYTFTYQKGIKKTSFVDLLLCKGVVYSHSLHKVSRSFSKVVSSEKTSIPIRVTIVDNIESTI